MDKYLSKNDIERLSNYVRPETLEPCFKQLGKKDAQPYYNRPTHSEVRELAKIIGVEGSALGLVVGRDARHVRRWQSPNGVAPAYSEWVLICIMAAKRLENSEGISNN